MKKTGERFLLVNDKGCFAVEEAKISPVGKVKWMWLFFRHVNLYLKGSLDQIPGIFLTSGPRKLVILLCQSGWVMQASISAKTV